VKYSKARGSYGNAGFFVYRTMLKSELRKIFLERRRLTTTAECEEMSGRIRDRFFRDTDLAEVRTLHTFIPILRFNEVDTWAIVRSIWSDHPQITTVTSVSSADPAELAHAEFGPETEFAVSKFGIKEPVGERGVQPAAIDLVLVPLLCIDERGFRVGYGKGLYDRFLAKCRPDCLKIGLSLFAPIDAIDDIRGHDVALDRCITPDETLIFEPLNR